MQIPRATTPPPPISARFSISPSTGISLAFLLGIALAIVLWGVYPAYATQHYFHPATDSLWAGLLAQLIHLGWPHLLLNLATLLGLCVFAQLLGRLNLAPLALILSAIAVSRGLQLETPPLAWYVGLSGALYGVWGWLALELARQSQARVMRFAALSICALVGAKAIFGWDWGSQDLLNGMPIAHSAHLYGYAGGLCWAACSSLFAYFWRRWRATA